MRTGEAKGLIGEENWFEFLRFMEGETTGLHEDGGTDWYETDVKRFLRHQDYLRRKK